MLGTLDIVTPAGLEALEVVIPMDIRRGRLAARDKFFQARKAEAKEVQEKLMSPFWISYLQLNEIVLNNGINIRAMGGTWGGGGGAEKSQICRVS